jgi:hypothetical protein
MITNVYVCFRFPKLHRYVQANPHYGRKQRNVYRQFFRVIISNHIV